MTESKVCRKVWTSYGISMALYPFIEKVDWMHLHSLNLFWYNNAVSRVQVSISLYGPFYFTNASNFNKR